MDRDTGSEVSSFVHLLEQVYEVSEAAKQVVVCHGCFLQLSSSLGKIRSLLQEVLEATQVDASLVYSILRLFDTELKNVKELVTFCTTKSKFYLLLNCQAYAKCIQAILSSLASVLLDLSSDQVDLTLKLKSKVKLLCRDMQTMQIRVSAEEEDLVKSAEHAAINHFVDAKHANELLYKFASVAGISLERSSLKREYDELRREKGTVTPHKNGNEVFQLDRIISILSCADALGSATEREQQYHEQRRGVGSNFLPPLHTFYCPITQDVMENPVEIDSGQTFEMAAIQKWFAEGHRVCPVSKMELQTLTLKSNRLLQQSIEEWKDRNTVIKLAEMAGRLTSGNEESATEALLEIQFLCEEKSVHKYWVAAEGLLPVLVGLLGSSKRELKKKTLATLTALVTDNSENRLRVCEAGAIEYAVRSLARDAGEARQAVALLSELCKEESLCKTASKVQGCILLVVTIASSDNTVAATNARGLLTLFSRDDNNVVQMAEVNYFGPLLECLEKGSQSTQIVMANTLSRMQLSDQSRALLVQEGVIPSLVRLASESNFDGKAAALGAFRNLSCLRENGHAMIQGGVVQPLLEVLLTVKSIAVTTREHAAATFANLAMSCRSGGIDNLWGNQRDTGHVLLQLMSLLNLTGPNIQSHILRALDFFCSSNTGFGFRERLRERESIQFLSRFMDSKDTEVRLYALKVMLTLTKDGGGAVLAEEMTPDSFKVMVDLFSSESLEEEKAAAMGILGNLPLYNRLVTERMLQAGVLSSIVSILERCSSKHSVRNNTSLVENTVWTLVRFTLPTDIQLQLYTAKHGIIPILVNLLSISTPLIKGRVAMSLQQFSENTPKLSVPIKKSGGWCCFAPPPQLGCSVHRGVCSVEGTFCLLEANAISPLIQDLEDRDDDLDEAALSALVTLVSDVGWEAASDVIADADGVPAIIKKLTSENVGVQEKALLILDKILRREKYKTKFGNMVQMPLVSVAQGGSALTRPLAARLLAYLNILHEQSSYF
ncbi:hypothetical protein L7F22_051719 [Adiantum nelumboides]|nr:hypothetical protein [Adiantum nelumboides]